MIDLTGRTPSPSRVDAAVAAASVITGVDAAIIRGRSRKRPHALARWRAWKSLHADGFGDAPIGRAFGVDHTTVRNARLKGWGIEARGDGRDWIVIEARP